MELNHQTKQKIKDIKNMINSSISLNQIIKEKFNTKNKKNAWLDKNYQYFSSSELLYLDYVTNVEIVEEKRETNSLPALCNITSIEKLSANERISLLISDDTLTKLQDLFNKMSSFDNLSNSKNLEIPLEYLRLTDIKVKNCRISESIYNNLVEYCNKNNLTITSVLNYLIDTFLKSQK